MVGSPVGEFPPGIFVPPAERAVSAGEVGGIPGRLGRRVEVIGFGRLTEPGVPVQRSGDLGFGDFGGDRSAADIGGDSFDRPQVPAAHDQRREHKLVHKAALHGSDLKDLAVLGGGPAQNQTLGDGEGQRLFAEDMFAGLQRLHGDFCVPVVRRGDHHRVDIAAVQNPAVVAAGLRGDGLISPTHTDPGLEGKLQAVDRVDIADDGDVGEQIEAV